MRQLLLLAALLIIAAVRTATAAELATCTSRAENVTAVTRNDAHYVSAAYQQGMLEELMRTRIVISGTTPACLIAHFSAHARITDNYVAFQVRVNGVPMQGHLGSLDNLTPIPAVATYIDDELEQVKDPLKIVSYDFFQTLLPGTYLVQVMVAAGSGVGNDPSANPPVYPPSVSSPVLTLEYR